MYKAGKQAYEVIKYYEKCRLQLYMCPAGKWTIGWGHVVVLNGRALEGESDRAKAYRVYPNGITQQKADELLDMDVRQKVALASAELTVTKVRPLEQHEFDAIVSLCYNCGTAPIKPGKSIPLAIAKGDPKLIEKAFGLWNTSGGKVLDGLTKRRRIEAHLFNTGEVNFSV